MTIAQQTTPAEHSRSARQNASARLVALLALVLIASCASAQGPTAAHPSSASIAADAKGIELEGLSYIPHPGWTLEKPVNDFRLAQYTLVGDERSEDASLVIYWFGASGAGSVEDNLARWKGQFLDQSGGPANARVELIEVGDLIVHHLDVAGTYKAESMPGSGELVVAEDQRLLATVVVSDAGAYYVKLLGPAGTVGLWEASWRDFLKSLRARPVTGPRESL